MSRVMFVSHFSRCEMCASILKKLHRKPTICGLKLVCDRQCVQAIQLAIKVCLLDLLKQMHISKPPHYWQQDSCPGTGTISCVCMCVSLCGCLLLCVCLCVIGARLVSTAHSKIWLTELARPIT
ncbi:hypothetical protein ILYODFUR_012464 [Ilyodon furcidens]|uniref:Uncharacterized protein n=1 Tax=Ilyodon furcidens TaxID=33524 RepID=A0ABV0SLI2_9TELE